MYVWFQPKQKPTVDRSVCSDSVRWENQRRDATATARGHYGCELQAECVVLDSSYHDPQSGSSNLFIASSDCQSKGCLMHPRFEIGNSSTYSRLDVDLSVKFGTGRIQGCLSRDSFWLGPIEIERQAFVEITNEIGDVFSVGL